VVVDGAASAAGAPQVELLQAAELFVDENMLALDHVEAAAVHEGEKVAACGLRHVLAQSSRLG